MGRRSDLSLVLMAPFVLAVAAFLLATNGHLGASIGLDYEHDAAAATSALARGDLAAAFSQQPLMGYLSIILRAPFVALAPSGNVDAQYLLGLLPCLAVVAGVVVALRRAVAERWPESRSLALLPWLGLLSAPAAEAVLYGHPEEPLAAALCVGAALAAMGRRAVLAGVLLGLAVATKQWAAFAVLPVLAAGTGSRPRTILATAVVALSLTLPPALADREQFRAVSHQATHIVTPSLTPLNVWAAASPGVNPDDNSGLGGFSAGLVAPGYALRLSRPLMALAIVAAGLLALRRRRPREEVLGLLAMVFLARCLFDPVDNVYYHAPFLLSLVAWETLRSPRTPVLSLLSAGVLGAIALSSRLVPGETTLPLVVYLVWAIPLAVLLMRSLLAPAARWPAAERSSSSAPMAGLAA